MISNFHKKNNRCQISQFFPQTNALFYIEHLILTKGASKCNITNEDFSKVVFKKKMVILDSSTH